MHQRGTDHQPTFSQLRGRQVGAALVLVLVVVFASALVGAANLSPRAVVFDLLDLVPGITLDSGLTPSQHAILTQIRLPRIVLAFVVGAALSGSGAAYQGTFRNPLADPYLLGVAAGAGLGAVIVIAYGTGLTGLAEAFALPLAAFVGALGAVALAWFVGRSLGGRTATSLILAGVAVASFLTAVQTFILQRADESLREVYGFILGRLSTAGWGEVLLVTPYVVVSLLVILRHRRLLDVMAVGEAESAVLGIDPRKVRTRVVLAATLATAAAVSVSGLIGFVGIIVPHTVRLLVGGSNRIVIPLSIIGGGAFLVAADIVARLALSPAELPIGVVTAFFGAPFFAIVLRTSKRLVG
ncbi:MAG: iron complex transport system permease protein [Glaciecola sp.]|jgi:iron complex transport system permease protein